MSPAASLPDLPLRILLIFLGFLTCPRHHPAIVVGYAANSATRTYLMYNTATDRVILTRDIKWHKFDGANTENYPTLFVSIEGTSQKTTISDNSRRRE